MRVVKITDLPIYPAPEDIKELVAYNHGNEFTRVRIGDFLCDSEEQAIDRIKEIYRGKGMKAIIIPCKE